MPVTQQAASRLGKGRPEGPSGYVSGQLPMSAAA